MIPSPHRKPLQERSDSLTNSRSAVRIVPQTPPRLLLLGDTSNRQSISSKSAFPTLPAHVLSPPIGTTFQGQGLEQGYTFTYASNSEDTVSASTNSQPTSPSYSSTSTSTTHQAFQCGQPEPTPESTPRLSSLVSIPLPKKRKQVRVNADKTFSVLNVLDHVQQDPGFISDGGIRSVSAQPSQILCHQVSVGRYDPNSSVRSPSCASEGTVTPAPNTPGPISRHSASDDLVSNILPRSYELVGGVRKVAKTPDLKQKKEGILIDTEAPPLPGTGDPKPNHELTTKFSFQSTLTTSTTSDNTNYKVYSVSPLPRYLPPSSSNSHHQVPGQSASDSRPNTSATSSPSSPSGSSYQTFAQSLPPSGPDRTYNTPLLSSDLQLYNQLSPESSTIEFPLANYELHGDLSPSVSLISEVSLGQYTYSRESLVVPPLQPRAQRSAERSGYYKSRSRETLRTGSLTSIGSVLSQETTQPSTAKAVIASPAARIPGSKQKAVSDLWKNSPTSNSMVSPIQAYPHQWSSQLSTVASVSEDGTDRGSLSWSDRNGRRSSGFPTEYSRQVLNMSSSLVREEDIGEPAILERPQPVFVRNRDFTGSTVRMVEDPDEYGDGITDMPELRGRPSWRNLSDFFIVPSNDNGRTSTMKSTSSSRLNSLSSSNIPLWAKLYYGGGENRYLGAPRSSTEGTDSRPQSLFHSALPGAANPHSNIYSLWRRSWNSDSHARTTSGQGPVKINSMPQFINDGVASILAQRLRRTSSVWSPHLVRDTRSARASAWIAPSVNFSITGKNINFQVILFVCGFIMPLSWIIASFLPLPLNPVIPVQERDCNNTYSGYNNGLTQESYSINEMRYKSTRWWRALNRIMAVAGLIIIVLIVTLIVLNIHSI